MTKPSRNVVSIAIICLAVLVSGVVYKNRDAISFSDDSNIVAMVDPGITLEVETTKDVRDTDLDGLMDWQEVVWGTDINKADTDEDGTLDGKEVSESRNPTIAGPNDKIEEISKTPTIYTKIENNSFTDKLSKNLFGIFLEAKRDGSGVIKEEDAEKIAQSAAATMSNIGLGVNKYGKEGIVVFEAGDTEMALEYGQKLGRAYIDTLFVIEKSQGDLNKIAKAYETLAKDLSILNVPDSLINNHVRILNNLDQSSEAFQIIANSESDPVKAAMALKTYQSLANEQPILFTTVATYLRRSGIIFDDPQVNSLWEKI